MLKVRAELRGCTYLEDSSVTIRGVKIYGEPYNIFVIVMMLEIMMTTIMMMMTRVLQYEGARFMVSRAFTLIEKHLNGECLLVALLVQIFCGCLIS